MWLPAVTRRPRRACRSGGKDDILNVMDVFVKVCAERRAAL
jgi:hypothetical protein